MKTTRLKGSLVLSVVSIILMVFSLFGTWYVWESESKDEDESREFSRDWKLKAAHDSYEYRSSDDDEVDIHKETIIIDYDKEEITYRSGNRERENKFGTDYENTVKSFYLIFFMVIIGAGILIVFSSGVSISFLKNVDRSNVIVLGALAIFFCLLPTLLMMFTLDSAVSDDNGAYQVESRPDDYDHEELYRYELEGSAASSDMKGISGNANTTFDERNYSVSWKMGLASYLPMIGGILTAISTVLIFLTDKDYFSHRLPYHPRRIPAPVYAFFPRKFIIPLCITIAIFFLVLFMLFNPLWRFEYEARYSDADDGDEVATASVTMDAYLENAHGENELYDAEDNEREIEKAQFPYMDEEERVMQWSLLFYFLSLGSIILAFPVMFFMMFGKLDLKNGLPLLLIPAVLLLLTPLFFMIEYPKAFEDSFESSGDKELLTSFGFTYDGSFSGSTSNNTTYEDVMVIDSSIEWGPCLGWYFLIMSGILYLLVPLIFIFWRNELLTPQYIGKYDAIQHWQLPPQPQQQQPLLHPQPQQPMSQPQPQQPQQQACFQPPGYQDQAIPPSAPTFDPRNFASPIQPSKTTVPSPSIVSITCTSCQKQFGIDTGTQQIKCPFCGTLLQLPPSPTPNA